MSVARYEKLFKALQRINRVAVEAISPDGLLSAVLDEMLDIFQCDRAWLIYPCDPNAPTWRVAMERTRPEWPGGLAMNVDFPMTPEVAAIYQAILDSAHVLKFDVSNELATAIAQPFSIKAQLIMAIRPKLDKPWAFGIHHCAQVHIYSAEEEELFEDIGQRVAEALNHFLAMRQLRESEGYNRMLFENSPIGLTLCRMDGTLLEVNPAFASIMGLSIEEAKGLTIGQTLPEGLARRDRGQLEYLSKTGKFGPSEDEFIHKGGHRVTVQISSNLIERDGEFYILSCVEDITERKKTEEALRVAAASFETQDAIMITDADGNIIRVNHAFSVITGYSPEEVLGKNMAMMDHVQDGQDSCIEMLRQSIHDGSWSGEIFDQRKNGQFYPKWMTVTAIKNERQETTHCVSIFSDITARKQIEETKLRESEERFRGTLEQAAVGIAHATLEGHFQQVNQKFCEIVGYTRDELIHMSFQDITFPADLDENLRYIQQLLAGEIPTFSMEKRYVRKDRSLVWVNLTVSLLRDAGGTPKYFIGVVEDITEHRRLEENLQRSETKFRTVYESSSDAIMLLDEKSFFDCNETTLRVFGCPTRDDFINKHPSQFSPPTQTGGQDSMSLANERIATAFKNGSNRFEWMHCRLDGNEFLAEVLLTSMVLNGRQVLQATVHDITERKRAEQQLRDLSAHLQTVREEEKASFAREIHDDLGGVLTALKMDAYWLARNLPAENGMAPLRERVESMSGLLNNAVAVTRRIITDLRPTILDDLGLLAALEWQAAQFSKRTGIECHVVCACGGSCENGVDKIRSINLFRIFQEALTNIARHSGASRVEVELQLDDKEISLSISDNGRGLPEEHTIASTSYGIRGMRERAEQLGGRIKLDKPPGGGLSVRVILPLSSAVKP